MTNKDKGGKTSDLNVKIQKERQSEHLFKMGLEATRLFTLLMNEILCFYKLPSTSQNPTDHRSVCTGRSCICKTGLSGSDWPKSLVKEHFLSNLLLIIWPYTQYDFYHLTIIDAFSADVLDLGSFLKAFLRSYCHLVVKKIKHTYCDKT